MDVQTLGHALEMFRMEADRGIVSLNHDLLLGKQWLKIQAYESIHGTNPFEKPKRVSEPKPLPPSDSVTIMPYSELVLETSSLLDKIMGTLSHKKPLHKIETYELSDSDDDDTMKLVDFDSDEIEERGKTIPDWASGDRLRRAVMRQDIADGDVIFRSMDRRCDLESCFGTTSFPYYNRRRV